MDEGDLPAVFRAADASSIAAQRRFLRATGLRLGLLALAAGAGGTTWIVAGPDYAGVLAAAAFMAAIALEVFVLQSQPDRVWYEGRAAAESAKSLAWRYAVGGEPFGLARTAGAAADQLLIERLNEVLHDLRDLDLSAILAGGEAAGDGQQITPTMRALRRERLDARRDAYEQGRIAEQQSWYAAKARWSATRARRWAAAMVTVEALGGIAAIVKTTGALGGTEFLLGLCGAAAAAITAWSQTKQHQGLATAYSLAANELASIRSLISWQQTEESWEGFVRDAERAISREHSLWRSSRRVRTSAPSGAAR
jgi:hypothetical protein